MFIFLHRQNNFCKCYWQKNIRAYITTRVVQRRWERQNSISNDI